MVYISPFVLQLIPNTLIRIKFIEKFPRLGAFVDFCAASYIYNLPPLSLYISLRTSSAILYTTASCDLQRHVYQFGRLVSVCVYPIVCVRHRYGRRNNDEGITIDVSFILIHDGEMIYWKKTTKRIDASKNNNSNNMENKWFPGKCRVYGQSDKVNGDDRWIIYTAATAAAALIAFI